MRVRVRFTALAPYVAVGVKNGDVDTTLANCVPPKPAVAVTALL